MNKNLSMIVGGILIGPPLASAGFAFFLCTQQGGRQSQLVFNLGHTLGPSHPVDLALPFFGAMLVVLMVITYAPAVSLWLPVQFGQLKAEDVQLSGLGSPDQPAENTEEVSL